MMKKEDKSKIIDDNEVKEGAWAAAGFALVLVVVGLPVWWITTTVYRASLPYSTIDELSSKKMHQTIPVFIVGEDHTVLQKKLDNVLEKGLIKFLLSGRVPKQDEKKILLSNSTFDAKERFLNDLSKYHPGTIHVYVLKRGPEDPAIFVGRNRLLLISNLIDSNELALTLKNMSLDPLAVDFLMQRNRKLLDAKQPLQRNSLMRQVPTEPGYDITITLMLPQPHLLRVNWDAEQAINEYLSPLLNQMKNVLDLRVRSQILYMTSLKVSPKWSAQYSHHALPEQQLPLTINDIEAKLGSFVSTRPSLHFIVYIPPSHQMPLVIHNKKDVPLESNSFFVPRWGGVLVYNPVDAKPHDELTKNTSLPREITLDSHWVMRTVISHLHKLFPIPMLNQPLLSQNKEFVYAEWQLDSLARARVLMYLHNIKITLQSLRDLVGEISNMVISDEVAGWVWAAVQDWQKCLESGSEGRLKEATAYCKDAFTFSDAAFFHPSMLALLYFPDNQKYAIYVPLFLPVSIPVILSFKMIFKYFWKTTPKEKI